MRFGRPVLAGRLLFVIDASAPVPARLDKEWADPISDGWGPAPASTGDE